MNREHPTYNEGMWGVCMFTVIKVHPYQKPLLFKRLFYRAPAPLITRVPLRGGAFFYEAEFFADKYGKADLSVLPALVGGCAQRLLLETADIPILPPLKQFTPTVYPEMLFLNTSLQFLRECSESPNARTLGFTDREARLQEKIIPFVRLAKSIKIYTDFPRGYDTLVKEILEEWGLSVIVSSHAEVLNDCNVVLDSFWESCTGGRGLLRYEDMWYCCADDSFALPYAEEMRRPAGTDPVLFAAALYELCNVQGLENLKYARLKPIKIY